MKRHIQILIFLLFPLLAMGQGMQQADTINDLRALPVYSWKTNQTVAVSGYWSKSGGGGGMFTWTTGASSTNRWTAFSSTNSSSVAGVWTRTVTSPTVDIREAGAIAGTSYANGQNNSEAIQYLLDNSITPSLPSQVYGYTVPIRLHNGSRIVGAGRKNSILTWMGTNRFAMTYDTPDTKGQDITLSDFRIDSIGKPYTKTQYLISVTNVYRFQLSGMGVYGYNDENIQGSDVRDCTGALLHIASRGSYFADDANQVQITRSRFGVSAGDGIKTEQINSGSSTILTVVGGLIGPCKGWGINQTNLVGIGSIATLHTSGGLYIEGCDAGGINLGSAAGTSIAATGFELPGASAIGIHIGRAPGVPPDANFRGLSIQDCGFGLSGANSTNYAIWNNIGGDGFKVDNCYFAGSATQGEGKALIKFGYGKFGKIKGTSRSGELAGHATTMETGEYLEVVDLDPPVTQGSQHFVSRGQTDYSFTVNTNWLAISNNIVRMAGPLTAGSIATTNVYSQNITAGTLAVASATVTNTLDAGTIVVQQPTHDTNFVGQWKLGEASGDRLDTSGYINTAAVVNTPTQVAGKIGNAAHFTRANQDSLRATNSTSLQMGLGQVFTIAFWMNMDSKPAGSSMCILGKSVNTGSFVHEYELDYETTADQLRFLVDDGIVPKQVVIAAPGTNSWHWILAYYDGANINISVDNGAPASLAAPSGARALTAPFGIGDWGSTTSVGLDGALDDVRIYKRLLSTSEKAYIYNGGAGTETYNPLPFQSWSNSSGTQIASADANGLNAVTIKSPTGTFGDVTFTNTPTFLQGTWTAHSSQTNFVVDFSGKGEMYFSPGAGTNIINILHATNVVAGKSVVYKIENNSGAGVTLLLPATWYRSPLNSVITNATMGIISVNGYGANNTNVAAAYTVLTF